MTDAKKEPTCLRLPRCEYGPGALCSSDCDCGCHTAPPATEKAEWERLILLVREYLGVLSGNKSWAHRIEVAGLVDGEMVKLRAAVRREFDRRAKVETQHLSDTLDVQEAAHRRALDQREAATRNEDAGYVYSCRGKHERGRKKTLALANKLREMAAAAEARAK